MFDAILSAMNTITSFGTVRFSSWAFFLSIAILVPDPVPACPQSSPFKPGSQAVLKRNFFRRLVAWQDYLFVCFVKSIEGMEELLLRSFLPAMNCMSSISSTSIFLYLDLNSSFLLSLMALISSLVNFSDETYKTFWENSVPECSARWHA